MNITKHAYVKDTQTDSEIDVTKNVKNVRGDINGKPNKKTRPNWKTPDQERNQVRRKRRDRTMGTHRKQIHTQRVRNNRRHSIPRKPRGEWSSMTTPKPYTPKRIFLETLIGYIEAAKCRTLDNFTEPTQTTCSLFWQAKKQYYPRASHEACKTQIGRTALPSALRSAVESMQNAKTTTKINKTSLIFINKDPEKKELRLKTSQRRTRIKNRNSLNTKNKHANNTTEAKTLQEAANHP